MIFKSSHLLHFEIYIRTHVYMFIILYIYIYINLYHSSLTLVKFGSLKFIFSLSLDVAFENNQFYWLFGIGGVSNL